MRKVQALLIFTILVPAAGCPDGVHLNILRPGNNNNTAATPTSPVTSEGLVSYLNNNSTKIAGIQSGDVRLSYYLPIGSLTVDAMLYAQGPRNFRMAAKMAGSTEVDLGSNEREFWYWIKRGEPNYQFFCSYKALEEGKVQQMPFPFQPEWVLESMTMGRYGPAEKYELVVEGKQEQIKLIERTKSPQGVPVKKVIVFKMYEAKGDNPQITDFLLLEENTNKLICGAHITRRQILPGGGEIPREMELRWPEQKIKLGLQINNVRVTSQFSENVFVRRALNGIPSYDLATGRLQPVSQAGHVAPPGTIR